MMRSRYHFILLAVFVLLWHVIGGGVEAQTQRQHDAHVHGAGTLNLVQEGDHVHIELEIPGMDIVGFEHQATSPAQKESVKKAVAALEQGDSLFQINVEAKCKFDKSEIEVAMMGDDERDDDHHDHDKEGKAHKDDDHDHDKEGKAHKDDHHDHDKEEKGHKEDEQHKEHQHAEDEGDSHSEFHAKYVFTCASPDQLKQLKTTLFDQFQKSESLQAQFVTERKQSAQRLNRQAPILHLN